MSWWSAAGTTGWSRRPTWPGPGCARWCCERRAGRRRGGGHRAAVRPGLQGHLAVVRRQPAAAGPGPRPAAGRGTATTSTRRARTSPRARDGRYLQLPDDPARRHAEIAKFSAADADAYRPLGHLAGRLGRVLGPLLHRDPAQARARARPHDLLRQAWLLRQPARASTTRGAVDVTRLFTGSIADLLEEYFESRRDARRAVGDRRDRHLGRPALGRDRVRHGAPPHRRRRRRAGRRVGLPARRHGRRDAARWPAPPGRSAREIRTDAAGRADPTSRRPGHRRRRWPAARRSTRRRSSPPRTRRSRSCACSTRPSCPPTSSPTSSAGRPAAAR